jgi:RND family efflux transporter MFP subunit
MNKMDADTAWQREALDDSVVSDELRIARRRRFIIIGAAIIAVVILAVIFLGRGGNSVPAPVAGGQDVPRVTVIVPGRQQIVKRITATGTLAARRDMPVGVAGEGGMVSRVLVEAGDWVGAGQTLAVLERSVQAEEARQLAASIDVAKADAELAQQELNRAQALVGRGFISKADLQRRVATRDSANARVRVAQAQLGAARARIGRLDIRAPVAGLVLARNVEAGQVVSPGSGGLFRMAEGGRMELRALLAQEDLARVTVGAAATVTPVGSTHSYEGNVWQIAPVVDPQSRQGEARVALAYAPELRPGGFASVEIRGGTVDAPLLPETAVQSDANGNFVFVVDGRNRAIRRDIKVGEVSDRGVAITGGLSGDERVVLSAGAFLNSGDKVQPVRAAARQ